MPRKELDAMADTTPPAPAYTYLLEPPSVKRQRLDRKLNFDQEDQAPDFYITLDGVRLFDVDADDAARLLVNDNITLLEMRDRIGQATNGWNNLTGNLPVLQNSETGVPWNLLIPTRWTVFVNDQPAFHMPLRFGDTFNPGPVDEGILFNRIGVTVAQAQMMNIDMSTFIGNTELDRIVVVDAGDPVQVAANAMANYAQTVIAALFGTEAV